ncbi:MAG: ABC transporter ATP-binding protein [Dehalococcoidia bacterium]
MSLEYRARSHLKGFSYEVSLDVAGELVVLFGHSGAGKSLTLQFLSGLQRPDSGRIVIDDRTVFDSGAGIDLAPQHRGLGYVVQDLALFQHMSVLRNIAFGAGKGAEAERRVGRLIEALHLEGLEQRRPAELSGGQQQRVALARALARDVELLLLDEPFSALDESLRAELRKELVRLRVELGLTILFVTHDLREAHLIGDRIAVFDDGKVLQFGARDEVFRRPVSRRVGELTGVANIWRGRLASAWNAGPGAVTVDGLTLRCGSVGSVHALERGTPVDVMIRAERVNLRRADPSAGDNMFSAVIDDEDAFGSTHLLSFHRPEGPQVKVEIAARPYEVLGVAGQKEWTLELPAADLHVVPTLPGERH